MYAWQTARHSQRSQFNSTIHRTSLVKVGADLCVIDNRKLLVVCDYYSNFIEVSRLSRVTTSSVVRELKEIFARYGIPDTLVTDNGTQFSSAEFAVSARTWNFDHVTSSPRYPQSNGKAENAVKTVEQLFTKCKQSCQSEFQALLDWRNTPTEGMKTSPAQRLMGRCCKTLLPIAGRLLQPSYPTEQDSQDLLARKKEKLSTTTRVRRPNRWSRLSQERQFVFDSQDSKCGQQALV